MGAGVWLVGRGTHTPAGIVRSSGRRMAERDGDADTLARLRELKEVRVLTTPATGEEHRTVICVVDDAADWIVVRSLNGSGTRTMLEVRPA
jgi:hypothetical protein